ncbi:PaaI family thioesterase [Pollutimonas harenae]|uniref:PaaI family thioesterase n=1 Tax=Pollutimonas harenae TaxID=657015 RepID=A0A853GQS4_9BURK|nr:PaaI family thioesterase [Pollutimonas harenae]NYT84517.1 PaaI family thioesterase [Pollutimonas harenae]TEA73089.1 PaaI family thioesterase [Pollutimonas harenae]
MTRSVDPDDTNWRERSVPGLMDTLGPLLSKKDGDQWLYGLRIRQEHLNPFNIVHGGTITTLMDQTVSVVAWAHTHKSPCVTVQLNVSFLGSARLGDLLVASGRVVKATGSLLFVEGHIMVNENVIATAQGVMKRVNPN